MCVGLANRPHESRPWEDNPESTQFYDQCIRVTELIEEDCNVEELSGFPFIS
jgi:hypothetical protein